MPWILQRYVFREMGKTLLLAIVGLTVTFSLGGGLLNMIRLGEATPSQFTRLLALLIPLAAAMTLPVAALFAATAAYGRLSADNEFVA
jgi:lipopolysaccharide export LptBFGC system permease protein LptF